MRLIVKEYVSQLKEKDELDILISRIFVQKGYIVDNLPKTGNRQYGVDIQLHNNKEILLFVVKQGNIDRDTWDGNVNAVRSSLNEISDVAINLMTFEEKQKDIRIIVATNGYRDENVKPNWNKYVDNNEKCGKVSTKIEFMGIDDIVEEIIKHFFNEYLFEQALHSAMRKALYFIGEGDYKREYYEKIVNSLIVKLQDAGNQSKKVDKACATLYLASQMICQYAHDNGNDKIAIMVSEYVIIKYWKYLSESNKFGKTKFIEWLIKFCKSYEKWSDAYILKVEKVINHEVILPNYNVVENKVLLYEILGHIVSYANYLLDFYPDKASGILNLIIVILNEYPYYEYAPYDSCISVVIMIYKILYYYRRENEIKILMENQAHILIEYYRSQHKFPAQTDSFEEAMEIEMNSKAVTYEVSAFWGYYLLMIGFLGYEEIYESVKEFLENDIKNVTKCVWFLRKQEESFIYEPMAMNAAGEGIDITVEENFVEFSNRIHFIMQQYKDEDFTFDEYSFQSLELIICHYYGYIPRVKFKVAKKVKYTK